MDITRQRAASRLSEIVGSNIRKLREARGITLAALADRLVQNGWKVNHTQISRLERGGRLISVDQLATLGAALGVAPWALTEAPACEACRGFPPSGFTCNDCGVKTR